jgi:pimeloyl-ACP methyl ester carboxylesterase
MNIPRGTVAGIPAGFREQCVQVGEVSLNYVVGPAGGVPLLLIPGQMESWEGYKRVLPELSKRFEVFVVDVRGHGKSTRTPGRYSYNLCGSDLQAFLHEVVERPALVAGLSSGAVLAIWLGANAPLNVRAVIAEDPPIFSSVWPRIGNEKFMSRNFRVAVDVLGRPGERDLRAYFAEMGIPAKDKPDLLKIPPFILDAIFFLYETNRRLRPAHPYDAPLLPYNIRAGFKFLSEYDTDFSLATIDGRLSQDFDPLATLRGVSCPLLLLRVAASRDPRWGLLGAMDDEDVRCVRELVRDVKVVELAGAHEVHMLQPERYIREVTAFAEERGLISG